MHSLLACSRQSGFEGTAKFCSSCNFLRLAIRLQCACIFLLHCGRYEQPKVLSVLFKKIRYRVRIAARVVYVTGGSVV